MPHPKIRIAAYIVTVASSVEGIIVERAIEKYGGRIDLLCKQYLQQKLVRCTCHGNRALVNSPPHPRFFFAAGGEGDGEA